MTRFRDWSARRLTAITVAWVALVPVLAIALALTLAAIAAPDSDTRPAPVADPLVGERGRRGELPLQSSDYLVTVVGYEVAPLAAVLLAPLAVLWGAWLIHRRGDRGPPT